jgi:hypothetical protein
MAANPSGSVYGKAGEAIAADLALAGVDPRPNLHSEVAYPFRKARAQRSETGQRSRSPAAIYGLRKAVPAVGVPEMPTAWRASGRTRLVVRSRSTR